MKPIWRDPYRSDACEILRMCFPYILTYVCDMLLIPGVSMIFMGWIGQAEFNACALGRILYNLLGHVGHFGSTYACDTLLSQAFGRNKSYMGSVFQRGLLIAGMIVLIEWFCLINVQYLTPHLEKNDHVAKLVNEYLTFSIITVPFDALLILLQKFVINHRITWPLLPINIIGNIVNIVAHCLFLYVFHLGVRAPPLAFACAYLSMAIAYIALLKWSSVADESWHSWTKECVTEWKIYLKLSIPGIIVNIVQSLVYGGAVLLSAQFGEDAITAQGVVYYVDFLLYLITLAYAVSATMVVGRYLGMQQYDQAKEAVSIVYSSAIIMILITLISGFSLLYWIPYLFHVPSSAVRETRYLLAIVFTFCALDFYHLSQASILKACGKQYIDAIVSFGAYILIGVPCGLLFIFVFHLEMAGYWLALVASLIPTNIIFFVLIKKILGENNEHLYMLQEVDSQEQTNLITNTASDRFLKMIITKLIIFIGLLLLVIVSFIIHHRYLRP